MTLENLNRLPREDAASALLQCCGARAWARRMAELRPFPHTAALLEAADRVWWGLGREDWLEAFRAHPRIGERKPETAQAEQARRWSAQEQVGTREASADARVALAQLNQTYEQRFGYIYIICATGKTAEEMLRLLRQRLDNDPAQELRVAAEEQRKIARLRLEKLLAEA
ncbi:MAG: 2-oxo-4-hydroxy-4-carboxy-5-ureidoimidazoline decarboxylase [Gemmatimonadetes bacterium]|nr:2-oxo-4-hydroxy-4-carboxy-5-ureidoimidazoline decarboxylase [Gemmatimonadota bacterium]